MDQMRKPAARALTSSDRGMPGPVAIRRGGPPRWPPLLLPVCVPALRQPRFCLGVACGILQWVYGFLSGAAAMTLTVEAVYENGLLKPLQPLPLQEHDRLGDRWLRRSRSAAGHCRRKRWSGSPPMARRSTTTTSTGGRNGRNDGVCLLYTSQTPFGGSHWPIPKMLGTPQPSLGTRRTPTPDMSQRKRFCPNC
jgi:hypothetical protein